MAKYATQLNRTASATASLGTFGADATRPRRGKLYDAILGSEAAPADNAFLYIFQRCTALGTSTAVTPQQLDPADAATEADAGENHTVEPTYTANSELIDIGLHIRALFTWKAAKEAFAYIGPAVAANGLGLTPVHASVVLNTRATARVIE